MAYAMDIFLVVFGIGLILWGNKLPKLFDGLFESVKDERQIIKMGFTLKIAGFVVLMFGVIKTVSKLLS